MVVLRHSPVTTFPLRTVEVPGLCLDQPTAYRDFFTFLLSKILDNVLRQITLFSSHLSYSTWDFAVYNYPLSATWHSGAQRGTAKECCGLSSAKAFNGQVMEI
jgi:hypothetical protein